MDEQRDKDYFNSQVEGKYVVSMIGLDGTTVYIPDISTYVASFTKSQAEGCIMAMALRAKTEEVTERVKGARIIPVVDALGILGVSKWSEWRDMTSKNRARPEQLAEEEDSDEEED